MRTHRSIIDNHWQHAWDLFRKSEETARLAMRETDPGQQAALFRLAEAQSRQADEATWKARFVEACART